MAWRRITITLIVVLVAVVSLTGMANLAYASPQATYGTPKEGTKVVLGDTSIDGPAIMRTYQPATVLAWTGTDPSHHLNVMTSSDGLHYGNKHILSDTSLWRPAVAFIDSGRGAPYGTIVLAWTGTDTNHTLNVEFIRMPDFTIVSKTTLWGETSFTAPALATINGDINSDVYLSWSGTDPSHTLNVFHMTTASPQTRSKNILWGWSSISRPNLSTDMASDSKGPLILSWTGVSNRVYFAYASTDRTRWIMPSNSPLTQQSAWAPSMVAFYTTTLPTHWLAWTGTGSASTRMLHVQYTQHFPAWNDSNASSTLGEWAISSPELAYDGDGVTGKLLIAWTGIDPSHQLNVAVITA